MARSSPMLNRARLLKKMAALPLTVRSELKAGLKENADELTGLQKRLAPVLKEAKKGRRAGALRDSIVQTWGAPPPKYSSVGRSPGGSDPDLSVNITAGNSEVRYAHLVEFPTAPHINQGKFPGTHHPGTRGQPFFYPPYRALKRRMKSRMGKAARKAIQNAAQQW